MEAARSAVRCDPHWQRVYQRIRSRRGDAIAAVAVARKLMVVIWHLLDEQTTYYHLQPQVFVRKLHEWAWRIGRDDLPAASCADFVRDRLKTLRLHDLVVALVTTHKGETQD